MKDELILILDFGDQFNQLIARKIREQKVYCEVKPYNINIDEIKKLNPKGIILNGGTKNILDKNAPICDKEIFNLEIPILGICYGAQVITHTLGGEVLSINKEKSCKSKITLSDSLLFSGINKENVAYMKNSVNISKLPQGFSVTAQNENLEAVAFENKERKIFGIDFHPEIEDTPFGIEMLNNFLIKVCGCKANWEMSTYAKNYIEEAKEKIGDKKVLCGLSGGVDSSVAAVLLHKAIGKNLTCIFVDNGLLRKNEGDEVENIFKNQFDMNLIRVDAKNRFLNKLKGVTDPETKRKIIGEEFIRVFEEEAKKLGQVDYLVQGTIYPDVIESGVGDVKVIKSHHNVGGLPKDIGFKEIIEPLRSLFKDEVRLLGEVLNIPKDLVWRQPFPGPGLAVRCIGEITEERLGILREADAIFREEIKIANLDKEINQYFAVITDMKSVGVKNNKRSYEYTVALRAVKTTDFMTAQWAKIPYDVLEKASNRIVNEVKYINRIVYDITSKPPSTIEWE